ncbi:MAG: tetratricopeptide repeat protein [Deltaproteobacteria bacterium]|nr:tetratricopeptide repeat protein [Deltaproteobacteria bacterium]
MSLIHQALKKVQTTQEPDALSAYTGEGDLRPNISAVKAKFVSIFLFLLFAVIAGWLVFSRVGFNIIRQPAPSGFQAHPDNDKSAVIGQKSEVFKNPNMSYGLTVGEIQSPESARTERRKAELEAARNRNIHGMELYRQGKFALAKNEFTASIETFPEYAEAYNNLGLTYKQLGDMKGAADSYNKALRYKSDYPEALNNYGVLLEAKSDSKTAKEYFKKAILFAPHYPDPYLNMAVSFEKEKKFEDALAYYEKFLSHMNQVKRPLDNNVAKLDRDNAQTESSNRVQQRDDLIARDVRERVLYLSAGSFTVEKTQK